MPVRQPLARRIVIAFTLMVVVVGGLFSLGMAVGIRYVEEQLVSNDLERELSTVIEEDLQRGNPPRLHSSTRLYASHRPEYTIPEHYASLKEGFSEVVVDGRAFHVLKRRIDGNTYILAQDQQGFQQRENALLRVVFTGFLLSVLLAALLGWLLARRVIAPVTRLANQVRHRHQRLPVAPLAPDYTDDEVGRLAEAFDHALERLRKALEREQLFTADISHELRTPLTVITTSCELLTEANELTPRQREQLNRIQEAADEMRDLAHTFLMLARGRQKDSTLADCVSLKHVAEQQAKYWAPQMRDKGLDFRLLEQGEDRGLYDRTLLQAVMSNLLRNALHYTSRGSVRLVLETGGFLVEDSGSGIQQDRQSEIFRPFFRVDPMRGDGLGLGLSIVQRICAHQGWTVTLLPADDDGSVFQVTLTHRTPKRP